MSFKSMGFIGGGRVTKCILGGLSRRKAWTGRIIVSDPNQDAMVKLKEMFPSIKSGDNEQAASADLVFLALHPPAIKDALTGLASALKKDTVLVSLAPKFKFSMLSELAGGFKRVARVIPNAPCVANAGFNPVSFPAGFPEQEKTDLIGILSALGECPEVPENTLEAYAIITAMGPTYLWFQLQELQKIAESFGLPPEVARKGIASMAEGTLKTFFKSGLSPAEVIDLIPVKPLGAEEEGIRNIYRSRLQELYGKLTG